MCQVLSEQAGWEGPACSVYVQGLPGTLWVCAAEAKESIWHILLYTGWEGYRDRLPRPVLISGEIHSPSGMP